MSQQFRLLSGAERRPAWASVSHNLLSVLLRFCISRQAPFSSAVTLIVRMFQSFRSRARRARCFRFLLHVGSCPDLLEAELAPSEVLMIQRSEGRCS